MPLAALRRPLEAREVARTTQSVTYPLERRRRASVREIDAIHFAKAFGSKSGSLILSATYTYSIAIFLLCHDVAVS
jgi:hypothetical protein